MPVWVWLLTAFALALSVAAIACGALALTMRTGVSRTRVAKLETALAELIDSHDAQASAMLKLGARERARRSNEKRKTTNVPDPHTDPAGWKKHMRQQIAAGNIKPTVASDDGERIEH